MTSQIPDFGPVMARLEKVERQNRRLRIAGLVVLVLVVGGLLMGQAMPRATTVEAEAFILRDPAGKQHAALQMSAEGGAALSFLDPSGIGRAALRVDREGSPDLTLFDSAGKIRALLRVERTGLPGLVFFDEAGKPRATLYVESEGSAVLQLSRKDEKVFWRAP